MPALTTSGPLPGRGSILNSRPRPSVAFLVRPGVRPMLVVGQPLVLVP